MSHLKLGTLSQHTRINFPLTLSTNLACLNNVWQLSKNSSHIKKLNKETPMYESDLSIKVHT